MTKFLTKLWFNIVGDYMKVKCFDENNEVDLTRKINAFISTIKGDIIDIRYAVAIGVQGEDQLYCFSALILYSEDD